MDRLKATVVKKHKMESNTDLLKIFKLELRNIASKNGVAITSPFYCFVILMMFSHR